ncbi:hypothetical protein VM98_34960, partial [Streptomyces rubellomurinus subsp. indigoferus]
SVSMSGQQVKVSTVHLNGTYFAQLGSIDSVADGKLHPVAVSAFDHAEITNMCQSVVTDRSAFGLGKITPRLHAATEAGKPALPDNLLINLDHLKPDATFTDTNTGQDASTLAGSATQGWT